MIRNSTLKRVADNISRVIIGRDQEIELLLAALTANGHVLLEDVPGTGKTMMAKALAASLDCKFSRIQFTPDLMPGDVTGVSIFNMKQGEFEFRPGPVFTNVLLADEINRATPRTQSSLLECMEEKQVTQDGETRVLSAPFIVIATQNPVEIQGTFPLPEAQLDRFLIRLRLGYPTLTEAQDIMKRFVVETPLKHLNPVVSANDVISAQNETRLVDVSGDVMAYIAAICEKTRNLAQVHLGASTRGMLALMRTCQALAFVRGRGFVTPDDVKELAAPVLAHRLIIRGQYGKFDASVLAVDEALNAVDVPTESKT